MITKQIGRLLALGVAMSMGLLGCKGSSGATTVSNDPGNAEMSKVNVLVNENGFSPSLITAGKGGPLMLEFTRTTERTCAKQVVIPALGISKDLPLNSPVTVHVPADQPGTYTFQCGMGMLKGSVVIQGSAS